MKNRYIEVNVQAKKISILLKYEILWTVSTALCAVRTVGFTMTSSPLSTGFSVPLLLPIQVCETGVEWGKRNKRILQNKENRDKLKRD